jgi:hypothetical protein
MVVATLCRCAIDKSAVAPLSGGRSNSHPLLLLRRGSREVAVIFAVRRVVVRAPPRHPSSCRATQCAQRARAVRQVSNAAGLFYDTTVSGYEVRGGFEASPCVRK